MKSHKSVFFSSVVASMSSFTFGMLFTSIGLIIPVLEVDYKKQNLSYEFGTYVSLFATIVFLGAFVSSYFAYLLDRISKDKILLYNNMFYFVGCLILLKFPLVYAGLIARFLIGLGVGITCCTVPGYIFLISNDSNRGFYMSFNSIGIVTGLVFGKVLNVFVTNKHWEMGFFGIAIYLFLHSLLLLTLKKEKETGDDTQSTKQLTIMQLLNAPGSFKSIVVALAFHIAQHACGIDYFSVFTDELFDKNDEYAGYKSIGCLTFSAIVCMISAGFIDKLGRKQTIIFSSFILMISTAIMGMKYVNIYIALIYMFGFNVGLSSIPWFITNEVFPVEYHNAAQRMCVGINWLSAFILSVFLKPAHERYGDSFYFFYSFNMMAFILFVVLLFKETKGKSIVKFQ